MSDMDQKNDDNIGSFYMGRTRTPPAPKRKLPTGLLTGVALFALAAVIWYAYPRGAEKYTDIDVPVVKADTAPIKAEPTEPGGMEVPHQDSTVFDPLEKKSGDEVEKLLPTPEEPMDKSQAIQTTESDKPEVTAKMAPKMDLDLEMKDAKSGTEKVVAKAPVSAPAAEAAPKKEVKKTESKPAATAEGALYIQLGSYRDTAGAKKDWERLQKKFPALLGKLSMKTEKTDIPGKGIYYRLQAGKVMETRAKEICTELKAANAGGCIVVKAK